MDTTNKELPTINWTSDNRYDRTRDFIGLAFMDGMSPKHISAVFNTVRCMDVRGHGEDFPWMENTIVSEIMMMTEEHEERLLGLAGDKPPIPREGHGRLTGPYAFEARNKDDRYSTEYFDAVEATITKLVADGMTKEKAIIRVNEDREARNSVLSKAYLHHRETFDLEYALDHIETYPKGGANG